LFFPHPRSLRLIFHQPSTSYYFGSAEGHEYSDLQVGDEVNPRTFFVLTIASFKNEVVFGTLATGGDTHIWLGCDYSGETERGVSHGKLNYHVGRSCFPSVTYEPLPRLMGVSILQIKGIWAMKTRRFPNSRKPSVRPEAYPVL
jgi:hypothetical protein